MLNKKLSILFLLFATATTMIAQPDRWQQRAEYVMEIDMDVKKNEFEGKQRLKYYNNSPDSLKRVFYHLYLNAFQPNSAMDVRSRTLPDPDPRVRDRIFNLKPEEFGVQKINSLTMNGAPCKYHIEGTILEVQLPKAIAPNSSVVFEMEFQTQIPLQIRRTGRNNKEGIDYSMAQWYPKMCEYDYQGWHANPYVGREFYGIWGDFDVKISIDKEYVVAGTGVLQNPNEIGYGYEAEGTTVERKRGKKLTWHFRAENVHDFVWAADPDYKHTTAQVPNGGPLLHFFYQAGEKTNENWEKLPEYTVKLFLLANKYFGTYPYPVYSVIQGGDGGMEYPMATLITGERKLRSLVGVTVHEVMHSWYQMLLGTNEALYPWMDEGFTSYASNRIMDELFEPNPEGTHVGAYNSYFYIAKGTQEEPLSTHSDHYNTNTAYSIASYSKGEVFLKQLEYVIGKTAFDKALLEYFNVWHFKHPNVNDFIRVFEKTADLELDWYKEYFVFTTKKINYGVKAAEPTDKGKTRVTLERVGDMPMPMDVLVKYQDGTEELFYVPLAMMRGEKAPETNQKRTILPDWSWTHPTYEFVIEADAKNLKSITIDPTKRIADIDDTNNTLQF